MLCRSPNNANLVIPQIYAKLVVPQIYANLVVPQIYANLVSPQIYANLVVPFGLKERSISEPFTWSPNILDLNSFLIIK